MRKRGWANAYQLAEGAGIGYPTAWRIVSDKPVQRVDADTLRNLGRAFGVKNPLHLLEYVDE